MGMRIGVAAALAGAVLLGGCETVREVTAGLAPFGASGPQAGTPGFVQGFIGGVAAEDPAAALVARDVLSAGGSAVDAAVAAGFVLAVTQPSRVGLGGGGACLVFDPARPAPEAVLFPPGPRAATPLNSDRPAAVPLLARGLFALHTRLPRRPFEELMAPAERLARFGTEVSRGLAADLAAVAGPLLADPGARAVFAAPGGGPLPAGAPLLQPDLAGTLGTLRAGGVGELHQGPLARRVEEASVAAGGGLTVEELRAALPRLVAPIIVPTRGGDRIAFLPPPADGGLAAAASFTALAGGAAPGAAAERGLAAAAAWRQAGGDPVPLLTASLPASAALGILPASAGLVVFDRNGAAVSCAFTLNNLFGTGRIAPGTGMLLATAPNIGSVNPPLLSAAIAINPNLRAFRLAAAGSGQDAAGFAVAAPAAAQLLRAVSVQDAVIAAPEPARTQLAACLNYLPGTPGRCGVASDPRGSGVAVGAVDR